MEATMKGMTMVALNKINSKLISSILVFSLYLIISLIYTYKLIFSQGTIVSYDLGLPLTRIQYDSFIVDKIHTWSHAFNLLGHETQAPSSLLIYIGLDLLSKLGVEGSTIVKFYLIFTLVLTGFFNYLFCESLGLKKVSSFVGGLFYMSNPIIFNYLSAGWFNIIFSYSLIPLFLLLYQKSRGESLKHLVLCGLIFGLSLNHFQAVVISSVVLVIFSISLLGETTIKNIIKSLVFVFYIGFLIESFWLLPTLLYSPVTPVYPQVVDWRGERLTLINILRLWGSSFNYQFETSYSPNLLFTLIPVPLIYFGLLLIKNKKKIAAPLAILSLIAPLLYLNKWIFKLEVPLVALFRDITRVMVLSMLAYSILLSFFTEFILELIGSQRKTLNLNFLRVFTVLALFTLLVFYSQPFWSGELMRSNHKCSYDTGLRLISYPHEYYLVENWLSKNATNFKVLYLPTGGNVLYADKAEFNDTFENIPDIFAIYSPKPGPFRFDYTKEGESWNLGRWLLYVIYNNKTQTIGNLLNLMNIKYIIIRKNIISANFTSEKYFDNLKDDKTLILRYDTPNVTILENKIYRNNLFKVSNDIVLVVGDREFLQLLSQANVSVESIIFSSQLYVIQNKDIYNNISKIVLWKSCLQDLILDTIPHSYRYSPGKYAKATNPKDGFTNPFHWFVKHESLSSFGHPVYTAVPSTLEIPFHTSSNGIYEIWIKGFTGDACFTVDKLFIKRVISQPNYNWRKIGELNLPAGKHVIKIESYGTATLSEIAIVPSAVIKETQINLQQKLLNKCNEIVELSPKSLNESPNIQLKKLATDRKLGTVILSYKKINPVKYLVNISSSSPFLLIFSESFNKNWKVYKGDINWIKALFTKSLSDDHFLINGYANAWYIKETGEYTLTIYYFPQSIFYIGVLLSTITYISCAAIVLYNNRNNRKKEESARIK